MDPEKLLGQQLGPYHLEAILGRGGMAVVYRARRDEAEQVALKVLFSPPAAAAEFRARFEREARTAARLRHPGIVQVLDTGQAEGLSYMAMTLIEGQTLADRLTDLAGQPFNEPAWQIADALYYAHSQGIVHRDVKPSNILLTADGRALLTDFGVAQAVDTRLAEFLDDTALSQPLACPRAEAVTTPAGRQPFENGYLLWRKDLNLVYILESDKTWSFTGDRWREGDPEFDPAIETPNSLYQPVRGFGLVWREQPVSEKIWAGALPRKRASWL